MQAHRPGDILVVDGDAEFLSLAATTLGRRGHAVRVCAYAREAREHLERHPFDALLCAAELPDGSGVELCAWVKSHEHLSSLPVALFVKATQNDSSGDMLAELLREHAPHGAPLGGPSAPDDFIVRPIRADEFVVRVSGLLRMRRYRAEVNHALGALIGVAQAVEEQNPHTRGHCRRVATLAVLLGAAAGCDDYQLLLLERAGFLHDIGKAHIPGALLDKTAPLSPRERQIIQEHTLIGERLCHGVGALNGVLPIIRHHHERGDGSGYPDRLKEKQIPPLAQLFSVVDVFDSLLTWRPYRPPVPVWQAVEVLRGEVEQGWWNRDFFHLFTEQVLPVAEEHLREAGVGWPT